jgi:hypothetical protein
MDRVVYLKPGTREHFLTTLAEVWPAEAERIAAMYAKRAYPTAAESQDNAARVAALARAHPRRASAPTPIEPEPPRLAVQLGLAFDLFEGGTAA